MDRDARNGTRDAHLVGPGRSAEGMPRQGGAAGDGATRDSPWVTHHSGLHERYKRALARYIVTHLVDFGQVLQLGSGTTLNFLMSELIAHQRDHEISLDLNILTTNLEVAQMALEAAHAHPSIFTSTHVTLTGGVLLPTLNSLVGEFAARNVATELVTPDIVFLGVFGLGFGPPDGMITYHFNEELTTQERLASRPTPRRVVVCDHTKLGRTTGFRARTTLQDLRHDTAECIILSSVPASDDPHRQRAQAHLQKQIEMFQRWTDSAAGNVPDGQSLGALYLRLIGPDGDVVDEYKVEPAETTHGSRDAPMAGAAGMPEPGRGRRREHEQHPT